MGFKGTFTVLEAKSGARYVYNQYAKWIKNVSRSMNRGLFANSRPVVENTYVQLTTRVDLF